MRIEKMEKKGGGVGEGIKKICSIFSTSSGGPKARFEDGKSPKNENTLTNHVCLPSVWTMVAGHRGGCGGSTWQGA